MKRTVPLLITAIVGFIFVVSFFTPAAEFLGELAAVWFDILAGIAFILGGGNLLKVHLKKISDRQAGWGYSGVTILAFVATLVVGLGKFGSPPAPKQEFYGETFATLPLEALPESLVARVPGQIPEKENGEPLPPSVRRQIVQRDGQIEFRGWMLSNQKHDLEEYKDRRAWRKTVEALYEAAQPPEPLRGKVAYYTDHRALSFKGAMTDSDRQALLALSDEPVWRQAVEQLYEQSRKVTRVRVSWLPESFAVPESLRDRLRYDAQTKELVLQGPLSADQRDALKKQFPDAEPLSAKQRTTFRKKLESLGRPLNDEQAKILDRLLSQPLPESVGERNKLLGLALLEHGGLTKEQCDSLFAPYRQEVAWRAKVLELFHAAHQVKYPWSGEYRAQGSPFWWLYEYAFKPLTATMFAMLAFYVASAAFRAFRAKNVEAILLLGTAFIILLGRTFAGVLLTDWLPDSLAGLKIDNLTVYIMQVFNTAGNRAIMIGIALGIASTSLKVLLGVDRSYLGSGGE
ncbi:MAG: hypothetical protein GXP27_17325 [Planctomycetes bacterium]|nr:hypothetical protein [Planctomycetota bacterium]